jgi:hypothetical protein
MEEAGNPGFLASLSIRSFPFRVFAFSLSGPWCTTGYSPPAEMRKAARPHRKKQGRHRARLPGCGERGGSGRGSDGSGW